MTRIILTATAIALGLTLSADGVAAGPADRFDRFDDRPGFVDPFPLYPLDFDRVDEPGERIRRYDERADRRDHRQRRVENRIDRRDARPPLWLLDQATGD
ncbi:MAG: hypothetical protein QNJ13_15190 [Paracoccaceae bacterium]|nr:hypothetical protein [Paracoccaceae bacterium]